MSAHTPTPWIVSRNNAGMIPLHFQPPEILGRSGNCCVASQFGNGPEAEANAAFIVRACNAHAQLVAALEELIHEIDLTKRGKISVDSVKLESAKKALAAAKG